MAFTTLKTALSFMIQEDGIHISSFALAHSYWSWQNKVCIWLQVKPNIFLVELGNSSQIKHIFVSTPACHISANTTFIHSTSESEIDRHPSFPRLIHSPPALYSQTPGKVFPLYTRPHPKYLLLTNAAIEASYVIFFLLFSINQYSKWNKSSLSKYKLGAGKMAQLLRVLVHKRESLNSIHNTHVKSWAWPYTWP